MKCPNCQSALSLKNNRCDRCGEDITVYKKVIKASNAFYNQGLMKAKVRDLTGAVDALRNSLELNKCNTNARNLLGLVYCEMGETVNALSEWVLSKHFQPTDNDADEYMETVRANPTRLEGLNQAIKKYNSALLSAKQGNVDLAMIQLKKVLTLNPKFLRAYHLLALLYLHQGEKEKARKLLTKASQIDINNTTTIRYMNETGATTIKRIEIETKEHILEKRKTKKPEYEVFSNLNNYKEDKPNIWAYMNLLIGVVIGICVSYFLITPTIAKNDMAELNAQISQKVTKITQLEAENSSLTNEADLLRKQIGELQVELNDTTNTPVQKEDLITETVYDTLINAANLVLENKGQEAALLLASVDVQEIKAESAKTLYSIIKTANFESAAKKLYQEGYTLYKNNKFEEAITKLEQSYTLNGEDVNTMYFLGRAYQQMNNIEKAKEFYNKLVQDYKTTNRGQQAQQQLNGLQ